MHGPLFGRNEEDFDLYKTAPQVFATFVKLPRARKTTRKPVATPRKSTVTIEEVFEVSSSDDDDDEKVDNKKKKKKVLLIEDVY